MTPAHFECVRRSWQSVQTDALICALARQLFQESSPISVAVKDDPQRFSYGLIQVVSSILRSSCDEERLPEPLLRLAQHFLVMGFKASEIDYVCGALMRSVCQQLGAQCTVEVLAAWSAFDHGLRDGLKSVLPGSMASAAQR